jgi:hypothetical protein
MCGLTGDAEIVSKELQIHGYCTGHWLRSIILLYITFLEIGSTHFKDKFHTLL